MNSQIYHSLSFWITRYSSPFTRMGFFWLPLKKNAIRIKNCCSEAQKCLTYNKHEIPSTERKNHNVQVSFKTKMECAHFLLNDNIPYRCTRALHGSYCKTFPLILIFVTSTRSSLSAPGENPYLINSNKRTFNLTFAQEKAS